MKHFIRAGIWSRKPDLSRTTSKRQQSKFRIIVLTIFLKEYSAIIPGLRSYINAFQGSSTEQSALEAMQTIERLLQSGSDDPIVQQDFLIMNDASEIVRLLYSIGFLGINETGAESFIFCHDGRGPDRKFEPKDMIVTIHVIGLRSIVLGQPLSLTLRRTFMMNMISRCHQKPPRLEMLGLLD